MSSGVFEVSKYEAKYGAGTEIHPIQVQPETKSLTIDGTLNAPPSGTVTSPISARVSGGRNQIGLNAELVRLRFDTPPDGYKPDGVITLPLLSSAIRAKALRGAAGNYLGTAVTVLGVSSETVR